MSSSPDEEESKGEEKELVIKVGLVGDAGVGKSLMVRLVDGKFEEDYVYTMGVTFRQKNLNIKNNKLKMMIWDIGGTKQFRGMLNRVCDEAHSIIVCFDLSRPSTLTHVRRWYMECRKHNKKAIYILVGAKYDKFLKLSEENKEDITQTARKFAEAMKCPLIFCSAAAGINVNTLFKIVISNIFSMKPNVKKRSKIGEPIVEY